MIEEEWDIEDTAELELVDTDELPQLVERSPGSCRSTDNTDVTAEDETDDTDSNAGFDPYNHV